MSISISKHIYSKLSNSFELASLVGDKIYTISTKSETTFPFIVYKRSELTPNRTKDRYDTGDKVTVEVIVATDNYFDSIKVAEAVRVALDGNCGKYDTFNVIDSKLLSADEDFIEDTFIQRLVFSFETDTE